MKSLFLSLTIIFMSTFVFHPAMAIPRTNPDISVNVLLLGRASFAEEEHEEEAHEEENHEEEAEHEDHGESSAGGGHSHALNDGFSIQEVEIYFKSNIDPYWAGNIFLGISQDEGHFEFDLEEVYVESLFIPNWTFKAGKFFAFLGRHNNLHTHYYPFIDPPLINEALFGFLGWNSSGASLAYLAPLPWYSEVMGQVFYDREDPSGILFLKNLWDLNDSSTLELDLAYGAGVNAFEQLYNVSLVYKYQPLESSKRNSVSWTTEFLQAVGDTPLTDKGGINSYIQWQFLNNWWLQGRAEYLAEPEWKAIERQKYSFLLAFTATEYSAVRLQYDAVRTDHGEWEHAVAIQGNMSLGTHPAHLY